MRETLNNIIYMARRFKLASLLNVVGLIMAFSSFYLLMTQIVYQNTYNHGLEDYRRLYRLESSYEANGWDYSDNVCRPFAEAARHLPNFESLSLMMDINSGTNSSLPFMKGDKKLYYPIIQANTTALSTFMSQAVSGSIELLDSDKLGSIIIPASIARKYFGTEQAAGKKMPHPFTNSTGATKIHSYKVRGVYQDFPVNCELPNCIYKFEDSTYFYDFYSLYKCYVKFTTAPDKDSLEALGDCLKQAILADLDKNATHYTPKQLNDNKHIVNKTNFKLTPLSSSYFEHSTHTSGDHSFRFMVTILKLACLLIILMATINFLNFTLAESPLRMRSVNTRLVLGADRRAMRMKLVIECVIIAVATCLAGLVICEVIFRYTHINLPLAGNLSIAEHWPAALITLGIALLVGFVSGLYPAVFATSFPPAIVLKASFGLTPQGRTLRTILVCVQLFVSMLMGTYISILFQQRQHILNYSYGFDKKLLLCSSLPETFDPNKTAELEQLLLQLPDVESVSFAENLLGTTDAHYFIETVHEKEVMKYSYTYTDQDFMRTMGIKIIEGRDFNDSDSNAVIINEATRLRWKWLNVGGRIKSNPDDNSTDSAVIVGVCRNFHYGTMFVNNDQPFVFFRGQDNPVDKLIVRIEDGSDMERTRQQADSLVQQFTDGGASKMSPYNNGVAQTYHNELRFFNQIFLISLLCLGSTLIGLFCLTMFETEYRRKEIAIRKVSGATTGEIVWKICSRYGWIILICSALAVPLAWFSGEWTLQYFAERAVISPWIIPISLLVVGGIMLGTVVLQAWLAARKNPAATIKTE